MPLTRLHSISPTCSTCLSRLSRSTMRSILKDWSQKMFQVSMLQSMYSRSLLRLYCLTLLQSYLPEGLSANWTLQQPDNGIFPGVEEPDYAKFENVGRAVIKTLYCPQLTLCSGYPSLFAPRDLATIVVSSGSAAILHPLRPTAYPAVRSSVIVAWRIHGLSKLSIHLPDTFSTRYILSMKTSYESRAQ